MAPPAEDAQDLSALSIEDLAQVTVRSASKAEEPLSVVPNSLYVITAEAVARSTASSLPEALRLAPNLWVQRTNAREYAITARGFNGIETANKLLVLIDGRNIYSTLHSGVFWELHSPIPADLAQIEVISGPGGTLYGTNAVNGVVNITTRDARDTLGVAAQGNAGARERTLGARYGFGLGASGAVRVYGHWFDREGLPGGALADYPDGIRGWQAGARADLGVDGNNLMVKGEAFGNRTFQIADEGNYGFNVTTRWNHALTERSALQLQVYYDVFHRRALWTEDFLETFDAEAQYNLTAGDHQIVAGFGGRRLRDRFVNNFNNFQLVPQSAHLWQVNGFIQDRLALGESLSLTAGMKVERSSFSGWQLLPNVRLAWHPDLDTLLWVAASRAVRTPSRIDRELQAPPEFIASPDFQSEKLIAYELGFRRQFGQDTSISVNAFVHHYDDLRTVRATGNPIPLQLRNDYHGYSYGLTAWGNQQLLPWWRASVGLAWMNKDFELRDGIVDFSLGASLGHDPDLQFALRSQMNLPLGLALDTSLRHVNGLKEAPATAAYTEVDARLAWRAGDHVELFVAGENLLHAQHLESNDINRGQAVVRNVTAGARFHF